MLTGAVFSTSVPKRTDSFSYPEESLEASRLSPGNTVFWMLTGLGNCTQAVGRPSNPCPTHPLRSGFPWQVKAQNIIFLPLWSVAAPQWNPTQAYGYTPASQLFSREKRDLVVCEQKPGTSKHLGSPSKPPRRIPEAEIQGEVQGAVAAWG